MKLPVLNYTGAKTGREVELPDTIFGITPNDHAIYLDVRRIMASMRQGTHKTKERSEVVGSTRKLFKQKGTGGARRGDIKSPLLKGGGRIFGPKPRNYDFKLNKKVTKLARRSVLSYKAKADSIVVLEDFTFNDHKTKNYVNMLKYLNVCDEKTLLVLHSFEEKIFLSGRNIEQTLVVTATNISTYNLLNAKKVLVTEKAIAAITELLN